MTYFNESKELIKYARFQFINAKKAYEQSLNKKSIEPRLLIEIKNLMENLRSALDFAAHGLFEKYGYTTKSNPKIYFPYATENESKIDFQKRNRIEKCIPGLSSNRPDITTEIESFQPFSNLENIWLPQFMDLINKNKHQYLTPQERKEFKQLRLTSGRTGITLGEGASISMGFGARIQMGEMTIPGGQNFDVNKPPITIGRGKKEVITWVSFHFTYNDLPAILFLKKCINGIESIVETLSKL